jgi:hypothetical protein
MIFRKVEACCKDEKCAGWTVNRCTVDQWNRRTPDPALIAEAVARERDAALGNIIHDLTHAITHAVWAEYRNSIDEKYVFRKEHVENAIRQAAAIRARGQG